MVPSYVLDAFCILYPTAFAYLVQYPGAFLSLMEALFLLSKISSKNEPKRKNKRKKITIKIIAVTIVDGIEHETQLMETY